jgi:hypothetical protein
MGRWALILHFFICFILSTSLHHFLLKEIFKSMSIRFPPLPQGINNRNEESDEDGQEQDVEPIGFYYSSEDDEKWGESHPLINVFTCGWCEGKNLLCFFYKWSWGSLQMVDWAINTHKQIRRSCVLGPFPRCRSMMTQS